MLMKRLLESFRSPAIIVYDDTGEVYEDGESGLYHPMAH
jgi:hypothetical protein